MKRRTKKASFILIVLWFFCHGERAFSQGEWNNWYFGNYAGLTFNSGLPVPLLNSQLWPTGRCPTVVSDSLGSLLFYSNGNKLWDRNHNVTPNGTNLLGGLNGAQPVFAIKSIANNGIYYLFTVGDNGWYSGGLNYSLIDMSLNAGMGDIVLGSKNILVPAAANSRNALTATRHSNNRDVWIVTSAWDNGYKYLSFLLSISGLNTTPVISSSMLNFNQGNLNWGYLNYIKISPDGTRLICKGDTGTTAGSVEYCSFNSANGTVRKTPSFLPLSYHELINIY